MSADQVTSVAGGGVAGTGLGGLTGALQGSINNLTNLSSNWLDRFFPPEKREQWKAWLTKFATEKPFLASFLLSQIALSGLPLVLFGVMSVTVFIFALLAGILVGVIGALLFVVAALGFALLILLPILFFTTAAAVFIWLWGVGAYFIVKWFNQKDIPGIHTDLKEGLTKAGQSTGLGDLPGLNGILGGGSGEDASAGRQSSTSTGEKEKSHPPKLDKEKAEKASSTGAQHHADGKENQNHAVQRKHASRPSSVDPTDKVKGTVDGVGKGVGGVAGNATKGIGVGV